MKEIYEVVKGLDFLINDEKDKYASVKKSDPASMSIKQEIKRLKLIRQQIKSGNFGKITNPIELLLQADIDINDHSNSYFIKQDILNCIRCFNVDYSIKNDEGIVLKDSIKRDISLDSYAIYFHGEIPRNLYNYLKKGNYKIDIRKDKIYTYTKERRGKKWEEHMK